MSERITASNLDKVVKHNFEIMDEVRNEAIRFLSVGSQPQLLSRPQLAIALLKSYGLIQMPVNDSYWSGALFVKDGKIVPVINTAIPRANQYFAAWHEIYHLYFDQVQTDHFIETETTIDERKADYFASFMLLSDIMDYYSGLNNPRFLDRVFNCMAVFQAPYKAVLISLYEKAIQTDNEKLKISVKDNFDRCFDDLPGTFRELGLDDSLVKPSYVVNCDQLRNSVSEKLLEQPDLSYHKENERFLNQIIHEIRLLTGVDHDGNQFDRVY